MMDVNILRALDRIPPDIEREQWYRMLAALKTECGDAGREIAMNWSKGGDTYKQPDFESTWKSLNGDAGITIGTLFHVAMQHGYKPEKVTPHSEPHAVTQQQVAMACAAKWAKAEPADKAHAYLAKKGILSFGIKQEKGKLLIPLQDADGNIWSLQSIATDGSKLFAKGSRAAGMSFTIPGNEPESPIVLAEGYATAAAIKMATGWQVTCAFSCGNLMAIGKMLREKYPQTRIIVAADSAPAETTEKARKVAEAIGADLAVPSVESDFCDLSQQVGFDAVRSQIESAAPVGNTDKVKFEAASAINDDEWEHSELAPPCIVDKYLYVDLGQQSGPGGLGKTTFSLFEAIHIVLGIPLFGLEIHKPGPVVMLTAEDRRPLLIARLRRIAEEMGLTRAQVVEVCRSVRIHDVTCEGYRLSQSIGDTIIPTPFIDEIIDAYTPLEPSLMIMDPLASFGIGEDNNAMQATVEAGRRIIRGLGCCLRYTHHLGQDASRALIKDQFAGRGGTALPNGCRIIHILQPMGAKEWMERTGEPLAPTENAISLSRPKVSYCPPQDEIFIRRSGYRFEALERAPDDPTARVKRDAATILDFLRKQYIEGERMTQNALFSSELGIAQKGIRAAVTRLLEQGEVINKKIEPPPQRGAKEFLFPIAAYTNSEPQEH